MFQGIAASTGIAIGKAYILEQREKEVKKLYIEDEQIKSAQERFDNAIEVCSLRLQSAINKLLEKGSKEEADILEGQLALLFDPQLKDDVNDRIVTEHKDVIWAVEEVFEQYAQMFEEMDDEYLKERSADMRDVGQQMINQLLGIVQEDLSLLTEPVIFIANDITPSMAAQLDPQIVIGLATEMGSKTSHTSIVARSLGIPAVVGCELLLSNVRQGDEVIIDGHAGNIIIAPNHAAKEDYQQKLAEYQSELNSLKSMQHQQAKTKDGYSIELMANIGNPNEASLVFENGGEGIGLFRSEYLYMGREIAPTEDEQFEAYRKTVQLISGKPLIIRTLDVGGDKKISYIPIGEEENPFLGFRAIRYCLEDEELFKTQLRAILRASHYGDVRVMFPMISGVEELQAAKDLLIDSQNELIERNVPFNKEIPIGIMIEIPSAALISDRLAPLVDFFSIGTNDLVQYTIAVDRMNQKVSSLYNPQHLAVLRLIDMVCRNAQTFGKHVGICGEMAGDPEFTKILIGLGVCEFSMSPRLIPKVKQQVLRLSKQDCIEWVQMQL